MGVPKFYRWISERYPCLSEVVKEYQLPEFDNLYLDMNGIIHVCSHPEDNNPHFRITEEKIFADICHYIEVLFRMIKPRKVFFMAIDGVAPRAKMNQQRGRRFRSAREAEELIKQAISKGETLPKEQRFDSNCITPGTEFMVKLNEHLKYFVTKKVSTDRLWQGPRIYLSGHETPGEGEHKIMDFIRSEKSQSDYDPNTRHCLYGLDADLIMLGLATHEPHFSLLREEVRFTGKSSQKRSIAPEETTFHLLHLSLMREYLDFEFGNTLKSALPFEYNLENIIDDWVLMGFLVGNDFIPHLPHLHIHSDCLPLLWQTYRTVLPTLDGYLNENGFLNLPRFEKYLTVLAEFDKENFQEKYADLKWAEGKRKQRLEVEAQKDSKDVVPTPSIHYKTSSLSSEMVGIPSADEFMKRKGEFDVENDTLDGLIDSDLLENGVDEKVAEETEEEEEEEEESSETDSVSDSSDAEFNHEFRKYKANYYTDKMDFERVTSEVLRSQAHGYVQALQWILHYYYNGVQSWSWYYPHHYAPYLSDVKNFGSLKIEFELGRPFLPFQQLMAVLPSASKSLLPEALQGLMVNDSSPVKDYYPVDFETDLNGKLQEWEAVVLIPFIDEERLLKAMEPLVDKMTDAERARNKHGPHLMFVYVPDEIEPFRSPMPDKFPDILHNHALLSEIPLDGFVVPIEKQFYGLCQGVRLDVYFPGFPTLKHLPHKASLKKAGVKVFQMNSRNDNMILELTDLQHPSVDDIAQNLIGCSLFVGWPHLYEALVEAVATDNQRFSAVQVPNQEREPSSKPDLRSEPLSLDQKTIWHKEADSIMEWYLNRRGVEIGEVEVLVYARPMSGRRYVCGRDGLVTLEKQWQSKPAVFAHQVVVKDIAVKDHSFTQFKSLDQLFPPKTAVFMLGKPNYGVMGEVESVDDGRVRASFRLLEEPNLTELKRQYAKGTSKYFNAYTLAQQLGITPHHLSRITGTVYIVKGKRDGGNPPRLNAGLNLKFNKTNKEVPGYTRKNGNDWTYSEKVLQVLRDYTKTFPEVFSCLKVNSNNDVYYEDDVFPDQKSVRMPELEKYLKSLPCAQISPMPIGTVAIDEECVLQIEAAVQKAVDLNKKKKKTVKMQVRPHLLHQPLEAQVNTVPDPLTTYELFDRVVNVREGYSVPLGLRGTLIGINSAEKERDVLYEILFDEEFLGGLTVRSSPNRVYRMPSTALVNITFGEERRDDVVRAQQQRQSHQQQQSRQPWSAGARERQSNRGVEAQLPKQQSQRPAQFASPSYLGGLGVGESLSNVRNAPRNTTHQQSQPAPVYKLLTRPKPADSSPVQADVKAESSQSAAKPDDNAFAEIWTQLKLGVQANDAVPAPAGASVAVASQNSSNIIDGKVAPCINGQPLRPPPSWLRQNAAAVDDGTRADELSKLNIQPPTVLPCTAVKVDEVEKALTDMGDQNASRADVEKESSQGVNTILSQLFESVKVSGQREMTPTSGSFRRQLTVEELFKGVDECQQWKPSNEVPSLKTDWKVPSGESMPAAVNVESGSRHQLVDVSSSGAEANDVAADASGITSACLLQTPGSISVMPIRPTMVELDGCCQPVDSLDNYVDGQLPHSETRQTQQTPQQQKQGQKEQSKTKQRQQQQQQQQQQPRQNQQQTHNQQRQQYHQAAQPQFVAGGAIFRPPGPQMNHQGRSKLQELQLFCQSRGISCRYEYHRTGDGRFEAAVFVNNIQFVGSVARTSDQAIESAAGLGLINLMQKMLTNRQYPAPGFSMSANSAFTPVQGGFDYPGFGFGMRFGMMNNNQLWNQPLPRPAVYRQPPPTVNRPVAPSGARDVHNVAGETSTVTNVSTSEHAKPQFVPTQVMRQQKTPQKSDKNTAAQNTPAAATASTATNNGNRVRTTETTDNQHVSVAGPTEAFKTQAAAAAPPPSSSSTSNANSSSAGTKPRKTRSRVAAKFGAINQPSPS